MEFKTSRLERTELLGMASGVLLFVSMFMPWFVDEGSNPNSKIKGIHGGPHGTSFTAWQSFEFFQYFIILFALAPFVHAWLVARGHESGWDRGEPTAITGAVAGTLVFLNGVILGQPGTVQTYPSWGFVVALIACVGIILAGAMHAQKFKKKEPPG